MLSAVIFDMDGLLIDSEPLWVRAEIEVFGDFGVALDEQDCARTKGLRVDDVVGYWLALALVHAERGLRGASPAEVEARLVARVVELVRSEGTAMPGVDAAIAAARGPEGRRIALASSSPTTIIEATLDRLGLRRAFDVVCSAQDETFGKPHPAIFLRTAERLGASPLDCVVLEDSMTGVIAAKAARMTCVAVPSDGSTKESGDARFAVADAIVSSLAEVTPALLESVRGVRPTRIDPPAPRVAAR